MIPTTRPPDHLLLVPPMLTDSDVPDHLLPDSPRADFGPGADDDTPTARAQPQGPIADPTSLVAALRELEQQPPLVPIPTGFAALDDLTGGGLRAKRLHVLCGPPGSGKTAFIGELARRMRAVCPILIASTEIEVTEQAARVVAPLVEASPMSLLEKQQPLAPAIDLVADWPVFLLDLEPAIAGDRDPLYLLEAHARGVAEATGRPPLLVVDYIQMLVETDPERRRLGVSGLAYRLKRLASSLDAPILAVSSVSRAYYGKAARAAAADDDDDEDPRDWLAAAKESGDVEFAASLLLYLDTSARPDSRGTSLARLVIAKARAGRTGFVGLRFNGVRGAFTDSDEDVRSLARQSRDTADDQRVLATIAKTRPSPLPWRDLRTLCGGARRADAALARLRAAAAVVERRVRDTTAPTSRPRTWIVLSSWKSDPLPIGIADA